MGKIKPKLLVICGLTASGKTKLAYYLAQKFNGKLISADSRMVYKYMDIGTGKDLKKYGQIQGYDLVLPNEQFSVSQYQQFANSSIRKVIEEKKLPILVGGSGLYIKSVVDGIQTSSIAPDKILRENLQNKSADELLKVLQNADSKKANGMNESDRKNPRRIIRAIEIAQSKKEIERTNLDHSYEVLFIGLKMETSKLEEVIKARVEERVKEGLEREIIYLKENGYWSGAPSVTIGYKDWPDVGKWKIEEIKYAKRQMTWFKKDKRINWFDINDPGYEKEVENLVQKWYANGNATKS